MSVDANIKNEKKVVGIKQAMKSVERNKAKLVYIANDVEPRLLSPLTVLCKSKGVNVIEADGKAALGRACGIHTDAAAVAILKD